MNLRVFYLTRRGISDGYEQTSTDATSSYKILGCYPRNRPMNIIKETGHSHRLRPVLLFIMVRLSATIISGGKSPFHICHYYSDNDQSSFVLRT